MAKGIEKVVGKFCVQTLVYWGNPQSDGYGGFTYDAAVELKCRWEDKAEVMLSVDGKEFTCNASVLLSDTDVELQGYMWLGTLSELNAITGVQITKPITIKDAYIIRRFDRIPMVMKTDEFVRTAYLFYYGK